MKTFYALLFVALCFIQVRCARAEGYDDPAWSGSHPLPALEYVFEGAALADMLTTLDIKNHPDRQEANPLMPRHPSDGYVVGFFTFGVAVHALITHEMLVQGVTPGWIRAWECVSIGVEAGGAARNIHMGLRFAL